MRKLVIIILILILFSITALAELSDGAKSDIEILKAKYANEEVESIEELIKKLKFKVYTLSAVGDMLFYDDTSINAPIIELIEIPFDMSIQLKGWEVWINSKCYYILLVEKED